MTSLLIPDIDDTLHAKLSARARAHARSVEEEARETLREAVSRAGPLPSTESLTDIFRRHFGPENGFDLDLPPRSAERNRLPPDFSNAAFDR